MKEFQKKNCGECYKHKVKPRISSLFHFEPVNNGRISHILYVKGVNVSLQVSNVAIITHFRELQPFLWAAYFKMRKLHNGVKTFL